MTSENPISGTLRLEASFYFDASLPDIGDLKPFWGHSRQKLAPALPAIASSDRFAIVSAVFSGRTCQLGIRPASAQDQSQPDLKPQRIVTIRFQIIMKKPSFSQVFRQKNVPVDSFRISPSTGQKHSQHLFLAGLRCPSDQFQFVAIPLSFVQTDPGPFTGGIF